jgi:CheY-like chemotaxis protein
MNTNDLIAAVVSVPWRNAMAGELILIVEDNAKNLKLVRELLQVKGYQTIEAGSAELGIELAHHHTPQLILMDIQLPGIDGVTALGQLRADPATAKIPVIALTAFAMQDERQRFRSAGFDGDLVKPINIRELLAVVGACCEPRTLHPSPLPGGEGADRKSLPDKERKNRGAVPEVEETP